MRTLLVVDDEPGIVDALRELFEEEGYGVVTAQNGRDALDKMNVRRPDLALIDVMMPVMSGLELIDSMRQTDALREVPVVLMSAAPPAFDESLHVAGFLKKPFNLTRLLDTIAHALSAP